VRPAAGASPYTPRGHVSAVVAAARELAVLGADLYKGEVPTLGQGDDAVITQGSKLLTSVLTCPWVVLSNGTAPERFGAAVVAACRGGASGFLAGRAIWASSLAAPDTMDHLRSVAAPRLAELAARIDEVARPWYEAVGGPARAGR
jgi:sulfofructosephosphate aldolase